ncbi:TPA: hypothetical protein ROY17_005589 [Bacillus thuringiensis]|nr:hypothetical protein [Bacillus thuringiensis]
MKKCTKKTLLATTAVVSLCFTGLGDYSVIFAETNGNTNYIKDIYSTKAFVNNSFTQSLGPTALEDVQVTESVPRFVGSTFSHNYTNEDFTDVTEEKTFTTVDSVTTSKTWEWNIQNTIEVSAGVEINTGFGKITGGVKEAFSAGVKNNINNTEFHSDTYTITQKSKSIPLKPHQSKRLDTALLTTKMAGTLVHTNELTGKKTFTIITDNAETIKLENVSVYELFKKLEALGDMLINIKPESDVMYWNLSTSELRNSVIINDEKQKVYMKADTTTFTADLGSTQTITSLYDITEGSNHLLEFSRPQIAKISK